MAPKVEFVEEKVTEHVEKGVDSIVDETGVEEHLEGLALKEHLEGLADPLEDLQDLPPLDMIKDCIPQVLSDLKKWLVVFLMKKLSVFARLPGSAFVHFALIELSPIYIFALAAATTLKNFTVGMAKFFVEKDMVNHPGQAYGSHCNDIDIPETPPGQTLVGAVYRACPVTPASIEGCYIKKWDSVLAGLDYDATMLHRHVDSGIHWGRSHLSNLLGNHDFCQASCIWFA